MRGEGRGRGRKEDSGPSLPEKEREGKSSKTPLWGKKNGKGASAEERKKKKRTKTAFWRGKRGKKRKRTGLPL